MSTEKMLGKIRSIRHGYGGYQDAMFGYSFDLGGDGWGVGDFWGTWAHRSEGCKWTDQDQAEHWAKAIRRVRDLMKDAKVYDLSKLVGVPVEVTFDGNSLLSWRILKEVV